jgi:hypothetical protein
MLPGIRFLFAAVLFAVSLVIFGLGAAALLRSAHEEFANLPTRRVAPPAVFAQQPAETQPTLSMLRVETPAPETVTPPAMTVAPALEEAPVIATPEEAEKTATPETVATLTTTVAPSPETPAPVEAAKPESATIEAPEPVKTVAVAPTSPIGIPNPPPASEVARTAPVQAQEIDVPAAPQPTATLTDDDTKLSSTRIATLGGPPVDTEPVPLPVAKPAIMTIKKVAKKPAAKNRRVAARPVAAAAVARPTDPFGQPLGR